MLSCCNPDIRFRKLRHFAKYKGLFSHCNPAIGSRPLSWSRSPSPPSCRTWQGNNCHRSDHWCLLGPHVVSHARPGLGLFRRLDIGHFVLFELFCRQQRGLQIPVFIELENNQRRASGKQQHDPISLFYLHFSLFLLRRYFSF